jgi:hypothetical protein
MVVTSKESESKINHMAATGEFDGNVSNIQVFILADIEAVTNRLSFEQNGNTSNQPFEQIKIMQKKRKQNHT